MENRQSMVRISEMFNRAQSVSMTSTSKSGGFPPRQPKPVPRQGKRCPNCSIQMSLSGICDCQ